MKKSLFILGINAYHPDSSACIIKDGLLVAAVEEERFRRVKHWSGFPKDSIDYCLKCAGIGLKELDYIVLNKDPRANFGKRVLFYLLRRPKLLFLKDRIRNASRVTNIKSVLCREFRLRKQEIKARVVNIEHHRSHLASAFFVSPFKEAAVVSLDGFGDFTSCMVGKGYGNKLSVIRTVNFPHSLGLFYTAFTQLLGFYNFGDEHRVMGLSALGSPRFLKEMEDVIKIKDNGEFRLNPEFFSFDTRGLPLGWDNCRPELSVLFSRKLVALFGEPRKKGESLSQLHYDIAASLQATYEKAFFSVLNYAYRKTRIPNLCLAGGCALNSLANGKISENTPFKSIFIQPASSDAGGALGAAYYLYNQLLDGKERFVMKEAFWGPDFDNKEIEKAVNDNKSQLSGCIILKTENEDELCRKSAALVSEGKILGWFQGRMEWGARALGNRSILVDPRRKEMKILLNERIKKREWFRPFAPSVLEERAGEYFRGISPDHFMSKVYPVIEEKRSIIPAVIHIDGSGRVQTVSKEGNPLFYKLIKSFDEIAGVPLLLNTSFNENEPIVSSPSEAIDCFLRTKMDVLVLGDYIIRRE